MTKFSGITTTTSPALADYLIGVTSGNVDVRMTIQTLVTLIMKASLLNNPYKFSAYRNAAQNTSGGVFLKVNLDTEEFDTGGNFDNSTNFRFTAPVSGFYQFNWRTGTASTTDVVAMLYKNGSELRRGVEQLPGGNNSTTGAAFVQATAGDYFEMYIFANATVAISNSSIQTWLGGYLVSVT